MDRSEIGQHETSYACRAGNSRVNLFTGRQAFEFQDITIGTNSYAMQIAHIYNNHTLDEILAGHNTQMGRGWKLNVQQYMIKSGKDYIYIDNLGYKHTFKHVADGEYYDADGLGLIYFEWGNRIIDTAGNVVIFKNERVERTISAIHHNITKEFEYDTSGRLKRIYDGRHYENGIIKRSIVFEYNKKNLLFSLTVCEQNKDGKITQKQVLIYKYDQYDNLTMVYLQHKNQMKQLAHFQYDAVGNMVYAVDCESNSALKFNFTGANPKKILKVEEGCAKLTPNKFSSYTDIFIGDGVRCGEGRHVGDSAIYVSGYHVDFEALNYVDFSYDINCYTTTLTDRIGNTTIYNHTAESAAGEILQRYKADNGEVSFASISPSPSTGVVLSDFLNANCSVFNATAICNFLNTSNGIIKVYSSDKKENVEALARINESYGMNRLVTISAWLRLNSSGDYSSYHLMPIFIDEKNQNYSAEIRLKNLVVGQWCFVRGEVELPANKRITSYSMTIVKKDGVEKLNLEIADIRATTNERQEIISGNNIESDIREIHSVEIVRGKGLEPININLSDAGRASGLDDYILMNDLQSTIQKRESNYNDFDFIYCGGKKVIGHVSDVLFNTTRGKIPLRLNSNSKTTLFSRLNIDGKKCFKSWITYEPCGTSLLTVANNMYIGDDFTSSEKRISNKCGQILEETDEYGVKNIYFYDSHGNIIKVETVQINPKEADYKQLIKHYKYTEDGEYLIGESNPLGNMITYTVDNDNQYSTTRDARGYKECKNIADIFGEHIEKSEEYTRPVSIVEKNFEHFRTTNYEYSNAMLSGIENGVSNYNFLYDRFGRVTDFLMDNRKAMSKTYGIDEVSGGQYTETKYYHGQGVVYTEKNQFDRYGRLSQVLENNTVKLTNTYNDILYNGYDLDNKRHSTPAAKLVSSQDDFSGLKYEYTYNNKGQLCQYSYKDTDGNVSSIYELPLNNPSMRKICSHQAFRNDCGFGNTTTVSYDKMHPIRPRITSVGVNDYEFYNYEYDDLGRIKSKKFASVIEKTYKYYEYTDPITNKVFSSNLLGEVSFKYDLNDVKTQKIYYDGNCNIIRLEDNGNIIYYFYDQHNNLIYEYNYDASEKFTHTYDKNGNRTSTKKYSTGKQEILKKDTRYDYSGDALLSILNVHSDNLFDIEFSMYDDSGNPIEYRCGSKMTWNGKKLMSTTYGKGASYRYNSFGQRTEKSVGNDRTVFHLDGDKILAEDWGKWIDINDNMHSSAYGLSYIYDATGLIAIDAYGQKDLYYINKDILGNVTEIYKDYYIVASYKYDAWGNCTVLDKKGNIDKNENSIGNLNPFRWKGYYYDRETGFYYINGNYYDPQTGRYINAGRIGDIANSGGNLFSLGANPVSLAPNINTWMPSLDLKPVYYNYSESSQAWGWLIAGIGAVIAGVATIVSFGSALAGAALCAGEKYLQGQQ